MKGSTAYTEQSNESLNKNILYNKLDLLLNLEIFCKNNLIYRCNSICNESKIHKTIFLLMRYTLFMELRMGVSLF